MNTFIICVVSIIASALLDKLIDRPWTRVILYIVSAIIFLFIVYAITIAVLNMIKDK